MHGATIKIVLCLLRFTEGLKYQVYKENVQSFAGDTTGLYEKVDSEMNVKKCDCGMSGH